MNFFKLVMILLLKIYTAGKMFGKICLKAIGDTFFSNICSVIRGGKADWGWHATQGGKFKLFVLQEGTLCQFSPLVWHPNPPRMLRLLTVMILKRVSNIFTACKVKDEKEEATFLMVFNLLKIIYPFQCKKHLRT